MATFCHYWFVPACVLITASLYLQWKHRGGSIDVFGKPKNSTEARLSLLRIFFYWICVVYVYITMSVLQALTSITLVVIAAASFSLGLQIPLSGSLAALLLSSVIAKFGARKQVAARRATAPLHQAALTLAEVSAIQERFIAKYWIGTNAIHAVGIGNDDGNYCLNVSFSGETGREDMPAEFEGLKIKIASIRMIELQ